MWLRGLIAKAQESYIKVITYHSFINDTTSTNSEIKGYVDELEKAYYASMKHLKKLNDLDVGYLTNMAYLWRVYQQSGAGLMYDEEGEIYPDGQHFSITGYPKPETMFRIHSAYMTNGYYTITIKILNGYSNMRENTRLESIKFIIDSTSHLIDLQVKYTILFLTMDEDDKLQYDRSKGIGMEREYTNIICWSYRVNEELKDTIGFDIIKIVKYITTKILNYMCKIDRKDRWTDII